VPPEANVDYHFPFPISVYHPDQVTTSSRSACTISVVNIKCQHAVRLLYTFLSRYVSLNNVDAKRGASFLSQCLPPDQVTTSSRSACTISEIDNAYLVYVSWIRTNVYGSQEWGLPPLSRRLGDHRAGATSSIVTSSRTKTQSAAEQNKRTTSAAQYGRMIRGISTQLALRVTYREFFTDSLSHHGSSSRPWCITQALPLPTLGFSNSEFLDELVKL
jgi:hypothetical protein